MGPIFLYMVLINIDAFLNLSESEHERIIILKNYFFNHYFLISRETVTVIYDVYWVNPTFFAIVY